jgi:hypothetical protein
MIAINPLLKSVVASFNIGDIERNIIGRNQNNMV